MSERKSNRFGINRTVLVLGFVSLLTDISSEGIYPLIPLFLTNVLHTQILAVGLIEGIAESTASVLRVFSGWLSDRLGSRKWIIVAGYGLSSVSKPFLAWSTSWPQVFGIRFADRLGKGIRTAPRDALIADVAPPHSRGLAFGFHRAMDTLGAVGGPLIAFWLLKSMHLGYRSIFLLSAVPALLSIAILLIFIREPVHRARINGALPSFKLSSLSSSFKRFLFISVIFSLGNSSDAFLILRAQNIGVGAERVLLIYVLFNSVEAALATFAGAVSDKFGRKRVILTGYIVFAAVYAGFGLAQTAGEVWMLFALYGLYNALTNGVQRAFAADIIAPEFRATGLGLYHTLTGLSLLPASLLAGYLWKAISPSAPFFYGAGAAVAAAILLAVLLRRPSTYTGT
ncbi:MAG: MFS transporter [Armatimonadota bacterium]|jgi:MFS family permease|nr:MFS transporter [Armatimonadota bacterium]